MIPPIWIVVRIYWCWIPLPVFLLWPVFLLAWIILGVTLSGLALAHEVPASSVGTIWVESWRLLCALRGTRVEVRQADLCVRVSIG